MSCGSPELGGRIDPDSEGHEMLMGLFGGLSKAERRRLQIRTRNAMLAHTAAGRWLGGRPNYGYRLVDTDQPHPQSAGVWSGSAVWAILTNPRYVGHQIAGRQRRKDELRPHRPRRRDQQPSTLATHRQLGHLRRTGLAGDRRR